MKPRLIVVLLQLTFLPIFAQTDKMDELLTAYNKLDNFNGTVLVAKKGKVIFEKAYGYRDAEQKILHAVNDIFQIGSVSKQITATVIMQLQEEGKLSVNDKLSRFYPDYPNGNKITIEQLMTHTSGIFNFTDDSDLMKQDPTQHFTEARMLATFKDRPLDFEPGTKYGYSNSAYNLLGYIIQKVTGKSYEQAVRERIFKPLGMTSSGFDFTNLNDVRKSKSYYFLSKDSTSRAPIADSTITFSTGGVYTTAQDLYKWERAVTTGKLLKPESWKAIFIPHLNKYGYGWVIDTAFGRLYMAHGGVNLGFTAQLIRFPQDEVTLILLDNASSHSIEGIVKDLAAIVYQQPYILPGQKKFITLSPEILQQYAGQYDDRGSVITITVDGNHLKVQSADKVLDELYPLKENLFWAKRINVEAEFVKDASGRVTDHVLHLRNGQQIHQKRIN
jgi:CubicO group peptidase (beta-lactamase class C family)